MKIIVGPRQCGKTIWLVEQMIDDPKMLLIAPTFQGSMHTAKRFPELKDRIIAANQGMLFGIDRDIKVGVDDIDWLLAMYLGRHVDFGTVTGQAKEIWTNPYITKEEAEED